jgi:hypothetical protein
MSGSFHVSHAQTARRGSRGVWTQTTIRQGNFSFSYAAKSAVPVDDAQWNFRKGLSSQYHDVHHSKNSRALSPWTCMRVCNVYVHLRSPCSSTQCALCRYLHQVDKVAATLAETFKGAQSPAIAWSFLKYSQHAADVCLDDGRKIVKFDSERRPDITNLEVRDIVVATTALQTGMQHY